MTWRRAGPWGPRSTTWRLWGDSNLNPGSSLSQTVTPAPITLMTSLPTVGRDVGTFITPPGSCDIWVWYCTAALYSCDVTDLNTLCQVLKFILYL